MAAIWHDDPSRPDRRQLHRSGLTSVSSSMSTVTIVSAPVCGFRVNNTSMGLGGRRWTVPVVCPPMLTVAVRASLPLELLFDGDVVVDMLLDMLNVLSARVLVVDTDGALDCHDPGNKLDDRGLVGDVEVVACRLPLGGDAAVCLLPEPTGRRGIAIGDRAPAGLFIADGGEIDGLRAADPVGEPILFHMDTVSVGLVVKGLAVSQGPRMVLCLDAVLVAEDNTDPDLVELVFSTKDSLFVTSCPSSCFGIHSCMQAFSTIGSPLPETTKLTIALYLTTILLSIRAEESGGGFSLTGYNYQRP